MQDTILPCAFTGKDVNENLIARVKFFNLLSGMQGEVFYIIKKSI